MLGQRLSANGFDCVVAPLIEVRTLVVPSVLVNHQHEENLTRALAVLPDIVIVLSAHAARAYLEHARFNTPSDLLYVAVGEQTAAVLRAAQGLQVAVPSIPTSEGVLAMPQIKRLAAGDNVWIVAGVGGRKTLMQALYAERHCRVVKLALYERQEAATLASFDVAADIDIVEISSMQGLQTFAAYWRARHDHLSIYLVVPSARIAQGAKALGFTRIIIAQGASADAVLAALQQPA